MGQWGHQKSQYQTHRQAAQPPKHSSDQPTGQQSKYKETLKISPIRPPHGRNQLNLPLSFSLSQPFSQYYTKTHICKILTAKFMSNNLIIAQKGSF